MEQFSNLGRVMDARDHFKNGTKMLIGSILLLLFTVSAFGQTKIFSREQMIEDIDILFSTIEEVHLDMYAVYPKQQLTKDIERMKSELEPSGDIFYFYKQVAPLVAKLGDGHTNVSLPFYSPSDLINIEFFPVSVKVTYPDKKILVQSNYTQDTIIPINAQITSINNRQANDIVQEMVNHLSGEKDFFKIGMLEQVFPLLIYALYRDSVFDIEYLYNQNMYSKQVKAFTYQEIYEKIIQQYESASNELYIFSTLPEKNIGIIELNSFKNMDRFEVFIDSVFHVLQKENIENLIIDIRENGGGNTPLVEELFQYISPVPFTESGKIIVKYSDFQKQFYKTNYNVEETNPNGIKIYENSQLIELRENPLRYKGSVFLLTSHNTYSAAADCSWAFKYFKMGTIVGEETGGLAVSFSDMITPTLPNSGLLYGISHKKSYEYGATDDNIHGTIPDYSVAAEKALDFTIDLITRKR